MLFYIHLGEFYPARDKEISAKVTKEKDFLEVLTKKVTEAIPEPPSIPKNCTHFAHDCLVKTKCLFIASKKPIKHPEVRGSRKEVAEAITEPPPNLKITPTSLKINSVCRVSVEGGCQNCKGGETCADKGCWGGEKYHWACLGDGEKSVRVDEGRDGGGGGRWRKT
ncbi:hypothetical protein R3P38DRAFT_2792594 [Favolaschia claudopus]|uniref:Uncharacterized protein n=1 Tax=Favolaschia claudopus TaxID=2862362 RepID=A0AAW0AF78_9AGAR